MLVLRQQTAMINEATCLCTNEMYRNQKRAHAAQLMDKAIPPIPRTNEDRDGQILVPRP